MRNLKERKGKGNESKDENLIPEQPQELQQAQVVEEQVEVEEVEEIPPGMALVPHDHVIVTLPDSDGSEENNSGEAGAVHTDDPSISIEEVGVEVDLEDTWFVEVDENEEVLNNVYTFSATLAKEDEMEGELELGAAAEKKTHDKKDSS